MSNIDKLDKQTQRDIAAAAESAPLWYAVGVFGEVVDPANPVWKPVHDFCKTFTAERVLALLDELEAKDKRIAELSHHLQCAHGFIEHTEAFGHEASNGILCCGDAQWNIDASKLVLAAAGKGE